MFEWICFVIVLMNVIGIAWNVVEYEVNLVFWYIHNKDSSLFLGNLLLLVIW